MRAKSAVTPGGGASAETDYTAVSATIERYPPTCAACNLRELCLPGRSDQQDAKLVGRMHYARRRVRRSESLYHAGAPFHSLYVGRSGSFKSFVVTEEGDEQITGFQMTGEIIGFDGIETDVHTVNVRALEDGIVCVIPFAQLERIATHSLSLQRQLYRLMSREIAQHQGVTLLLATMPAEARVAAFLLDLSRRFSTRGYSAAEFLLRMTREEIGSYLGLKLETVSRAFSRLQQARLIDVESRHIRLRNLLGLKALVGGDKPRHGNPREFAELYRRVVTLAPPPIGVGPAPAVRGEMEAALTDTTSAAG